MMYEIMTGKSRAIVEAHEIRVEDGRTMLVNEKGQIVAVAPARAIVAEMDAQREECRCYKPAKAKLRGLGE